MYRSYPRTNPFERIKKKRLRLEALRIDRYRFLPVEKPISTGETRLMSQKKKQAYTEDKIKTLSSLEHIRLRTGMYIGRTGSGAHYDDGIYILVKEVIDNGIDEFIMGHGERINVSIEDDMVTIRDFGQGIPLGKVVDCVSKINTGAKYNDDVFQFGVGLNGVGTKAVNALSTYFLVRSHREGDFVEAEFEAGNLVREEEGKTDEPNGTLVSFTRSIHL